MGFLDEFGASVPMLGAPAIREDLQLTYAGAGGLLLTVPLLAALILEPLVLAWSDRLPKKNFLLVGALATMGLSSLGLAAATSPWLFAVLNVIHGPANGLSTGLAEVRLVEAAGEQRERVLARWTAMGTVGDLLGPILFAALTALGMDFRAGFLVTGAVGLALALLCARLPEDEPQTEEDDEAEPFDWHRLWREPSRVMTEHGTLLLWLGAAAACCLLDEVFIAFGSMWLEERRNLGPAFAGFCFGAFSLGGLVGLFCMNRWTDNPRVLLMGVCGVSILSLASFLASTEAWALLLAAGFLGAATIPQYPLAEARAYSELPGRTGTVLALSTLFSPIELLVPWALGVSASRYGLEWTLSLLVLQPIIVGAVAWKVGSPKESDEPVR